MPLTIGETAPDFTAETTGGDINFHDWIGDGWAVLFSHPRAFTPICTTELGRLAQLKPEFERRGAKIIAISTDPVDESARWAQDIEQLGGTAVDYPIIGDHDHEISKLYGMLPPEVEGDPTARTPAQNATLRNVFVIGPDKQIKLVLVYPMSTGRNFDEILRALDALQLTAEHQLSTPVEWQPGEDAVLAGTVSDEEARELYPEGFEQPLPYIRLVHTAQPA
jgi:alkyl hydroperoxide reductase subunit AhpC